MRWTGNSSPLTLRPPRPTKAPITFFEPKEYARLRATAQGKEPHATLIEMGIATGMRQGELLALRWQETDLVNGTITVNRTARRFTGKGIVYGAPKSYRSQRPVKLAADTKALLQAHQARQSDAKLLADTAWTNNDLVFCGPLGGPIDARNALRAYQRLTVLAGLGKVPFHTLRHTSGTMAARAGINPKYISDRLGHANATFTINTYVHTTTDAESMAAEAIAGAMRTAGDAQHSDASGSTN